ncbi:MAG TPA: adenylate/guanylate cyclase domain-containing protein [Candidatus Binatia bacterium]|nr:adenylate/guanylate cyclase domain-containing protein [Candidatus Binatia bacterium]
MRCPQCQHENRAGAKFCSACGAKQDLRCPACGTATEPGAAFCDNCGTALTAKPRANRGKGERAKRKTAANAGPRTPDARPISYTPPHLAERIRAEQATMAARGATDGERKTITALFADLKGSTALIEGLDPEDARAIIDPALQLMMDAVHRYEGYVAQALGDGIFALFGAPIAHEDHPQRALYAALRMQDEMRRYTDTLRGKGYPPLLMRVGLNTGEVVVRSIHKDDLHTDYVPVGHSTNLAARMEQLANPGAIVVSAYTHRLTDGYFAFKDLGPTQIKGVEEPLNVYEVLGAGPLRTKLQVAARRGLTRFVGRHSEMEQLQWVLEQAKAGHGQIVGVMGEPGLGKSRLFYEFKLLSLSGCLILEAYSVSHGKASPYLPVIELLKGYFDIQAHDDERKRREKVAGKVLMLDRSLEDTLPYLFMLLGLEGPTSPLHQMDAQIRRRRTFEALKKLFLRESLNQPLVLIFEDLHWIDSETQGFLDVLSESVASAKLLLLTNYRPEYRHEWGQKTYYTQLRLAPFGRAEAGEFLDALLGAGVETHGQWKSQVEAAPLHALKQLILEKTEGTPFFMEEVVQELFEQGVLIRDSIGARLRPGFSSIGHVPLPTELHIPITVQGVLAARIDRLAPDEKALLQQLAVIGREFPLSLIRQVVSHPENELYRVLSTLQRKEFLYEQPAFPESEYIFKHALTQEVAYGTVLQEQRKLLHERTGQALETLYAATLHEHYSDLAHHYRRSANTEKAIHFLQLAGQQAVQRSAHTEAISDLTAALDLLMTRPETPERATWELALRLALGPALMATQGYAAPEVGQHYTRARALCEQLGNTPQLFPVLWGLWSYHVQSELRTAQVLAEECLRLAEQTNEAGLRLEAHFAAGATFLFRGEFVRARVALDQSVALYQPQHQALTTLYGGHDPGVIGRCWAALALWSLGYPDQALMRSHEALRLAQELGHPYSLAFALTLAAWLHQWRGEGQVAQERAEAAMALSSEQGFSFWWAWGTLHRGGALIVRGQWDEGLAQLREGLDAVVGELNRTLHLASLAAGYGRAGRADDGLAAVAEALRLVDKNDERLYEAELYRLKGKLVLQSAVRSPESKPPNPHSAIRIPQLEAEAEACFHKALDIARKQQAKSLELRAATSLARLWQQQGKKNEAHQMLAEIYGWFTEGFETKDLQEAKAFLDKLG